MIRCENLTMSSLKPHHSSVDQLNFCIYSPLIVCNCHLLETVQKISRRKLKGEIKLVQRLLLKWNRSTVYSCLVFFYSNLRYTIPTSQIQVINGTIEYTPNDIILFPQLPKCIAYYLSDNVIKRKMIHWQSILHCSGLLIEFQGFLLKGVTGMF